ncbi:MAG TPA: PAS domain S-box protein [Burkholderiales bacterium]|nr:PAS domain S-box protein [Burkholderiales bacterium]
MDFHWERLKPVLDHAPVVVFARDLQGRYLYVNLAFQKLIGKGPEEIIGRSMDEVLPPEVAGTIRDSDREVIDTGQGVVVEAIAVYGSGRRTIMNFKFPLPGADGRAEAVLGIGTDVTDRRRREEALQAAALAVSSAKGDAVFQELTRYLAVILNAELALIGRFTDKSPRTVQTLGMFGGGAYRENFEYPLDITPCRNVVDGSFSVVPRDVVREYPQDEYLQTMGAESYAGFPLKDGDGNIAGVIAVVSKKPLVDQHLIESVLKIFAVRAGAEIERRDHEEGLRKSESQYRSIFDATTDSLVLRDADFRIVDVNPAYEAMSGRQRAEVLGAGALTMSVPEMNEYVRGLHDQVLAGEPVVFETQAIKKDGTRFEMETRGVPIMHQGRPHVLYIGRDISARKSEEELLRASEEQYRAIFNAAADALVLRDPDARIVDVNRAFLEISGFTRGEVLSESRWIFALPEMSALAKDMHRRVIAGESVHFEIKARRKDGAPIDIEMRAVPIRYRGRPHALGMARDITARKREEAERAELEAQLRQAQKMEAIGHLTGGIAHDFNNILQGILGNLTLAQEHVESQRDAKLDRYLERAHVSASRARELIPQMLTFSRGKRGAPRVLALPPLVAEAAQLLRPALPSSIELETRLEENVGAVRADPVQLEQVLLNLCINARDAMAGTGQIALAVRTAPERSGVCTSCRQKFAGRFVELSVRDSGPGIAPGVIDRMFEPFYSTKEVGKGSGMGLSMVHGIVHEHRGHLIVDTMRGRGSTFRILLPDAEEAIQEFRLERQQSRAKARLSGSVMVVDDEDVILEFIGDLLQGWGLDVMLMPNGVDAQRAFAAQPQRYDLVLTDQTMPRLTGLELARRIRGIRADTPVILYTGYGEEISDAELDSAGVRALARKPVEPAELLTLVRTHLKQKGNVLK